MPRKKDWAEKKTDKLISELEEDIKAEYDKAFQETAKKYNKYMDAFRSKDEAKKQQVADGTISQSEYIEWRKGQVLIGERWKEMRDTLAEDYTKADQKALSMINGYTPEAYALNHNYGTFEVEKGSKVNTSYTLYDRHTVERLIRDDPKMLPKRKLDIPKDKIWNRRHINSAITQGILQGDDIMSISKRLRQVTDMDKKAAIRNARTMMTGAQNAGRLDAYHRADEMGIKVRKQWVATLDERTRSSHAEIDGEIVDMDEKFSNGLEYPGDPEGEPEEVYNCRCTMVADVPEYPDDDLQRYDNIEGKPIDYMSYEEWAKMREEDKDEADEEDGYKITLHDIGTAPERPRRTDYITAEVDTDEYWEQYREFENAREEYKKQREEYKSKLEQFVSEQTNIPSMTVEGMENWCDTNGVHIYGDISEVDGRAFTAFTKRQEKLFEDFPIVKEYRKEHGYLGKFNVSFEQEDSSFIAEASTGFTFGKRFSDYEDLIRSCVADDDAGEFRVLGDGTINQIFDHEFGHNLYNAMQYNVYESAGKYKDYGKDEYGGLKRETLDHMLDLRKDLIENVYNKNGMSEYAGTNDDELFAEAFSAWYGGEKTDFANAMGDFLRRHGVIE